MQPETYYNQRLIKLRTDLEQLHKKKSAIGWMRFGTIAAIIAGIYLLWSLGWMYITAATLLILIIFFRLVFNDLKTSAAIRHTTHLVNINADELRAIEQDFYHFDAGTAFLPKEHLYANDLDIFGRASLYQFINRATSEPGNSTLAQWLMQPAGTDTILQRQDAVKELSAMSEWRQELQALGREQKIQFSTLHRLEHWLREKDSFTPARAWDLIKYILPAIILSVSALTIFGFLSLNVLYGFLFVFAVIAFRINKKVVPIHEQLSRIVDEIDVLSGSIALIEQTTFRSPLLLQLKEAFTNAHDKASKDLQQLRKLLDRLDIRYNIVLAAPLNLFLLWNLQQVTALEKWKKRNGKQISSWFGALGKLEALASFSNMAYNNPDWYYPGFEAGHFFIEGKDIGHPLIRASKCVNNPIRIGNSSELMLVTGSNMAGKSTYLRSIGVNILLAMAGAPVCASYFRLSPVQVISSMRIADNLEESTSTFYAELKKLKTIIEKVNKGEQVFILLDEILRGTNTLDRHTGSVALIKQLIRHNAVGIIATHDVELAELKKTYPNNILNYHFDVQVSNDELYFDYKLKEGVCTSMNASILMKKIGIEL